MAAPALTFGQWISQFGTPQSSSFQDATTTARNKAGFAAYNQKRQTQLTQEREEAALNSPAAVAQRRADENFQQALNIINANQQAAAGLGQPGDTGAQALINRELEFGASAANRAQNLARERAGASGLGAGGGLDTVQRLIQEDFNRRGIASMRDIRSGLLAEGRAGVTRANEQAANLFTNQSFQLPESGVGASSIGAFPNFNFATQGATTSVPTTSGAKAFTSAAPQLTKLPLSSGARSFTARRF